MNTARPTLRAATVSGRDVGWEGLTSDGHVVRIRPITVAGDARPRALAGRVSDRSLYLRFFSFNRAVAETCLETLSRPCDEDHVAVVAEMAGDTIAVAGFERTGQQEAEVALLVEDAHQHEGVGTLLLEELVVRARGLGVTRLVADVLTENWRMLDVFRSLRLHVEAEQRTCGVVHMELSTELDADVFAGMDEREACAERASLASLFLPASVAVIGAGRSGGGVGHEVLRSIVAGGFRGTVHVVNPNASEVAGVPSYAHVNDIPEQIDLALVAVPAGELLTVIEDCGAVGVRAAVVLTAGLAEIGPDGARRQDQLLASARRHGLRLVGPNCLGLVNTDPDVRLNAWFGATALVPGGLAIGTQSGAVGIAMADRAVRGGLGIAALVSLGNKMDVSGNDLLLEWWHEPRVKVIALYLESLGNPRKFARLARAVGASTPVLVVKGGRSSGGARAGRSHTAAASSPETAVSALFAQSGVVRLDSVEELVAVARLLATQPIPRGGRLGIVGNGGGIGVLAADAAQGVGLQVPSLSPDVREWTGGLDNPVDLGAGASPAQLRDVLEAVAGSGEVDAVLLTLTATRSNDVDALLAEVTAATLPKVTVLINVVGAGVPATELPLARGDTAPVYEFPEAAVRALGPVVQYGRWTRTPPGALCRPAGVQPNRARELVAAALAGCGDGGWLDARTTRDLLDCYGITSAPIRLAGSREEAIAAAAGLGYPAVLKTDLASVVHKTDVGGVRVGLADPTAVGDAYDEVTSRLGGGVVVQPTVAAIVELVIGVTREDTFGPLIMVGLGGGLTDLLGDRSFGLLPVTDRAAASLLRSLRVSPVLFGFRGAPPVDLGALQDLVLRVSALATDLPEVAELDLNPVMAGVSAATVVDAKLRLSTPVAVPDDQRPALTP